MVCALEGDTYFPNLNLSGFREVSQTFYEKDENAFGFTSHCI